MEDDPPIRNPPGVPGEAPLPAAAPVANAAPAAPPLAAPGAAAAVPAAPGAAAPVPAAPGAAAPVPAGAPHPNHDFIDRINDQDHDPGQFVPRDLFGTFAVDDNATPFTHHYWAQTRVNFVSGVQEPKRVLGKQEILKYTQAATAIADTTHWIELYNTWRTFVVPAQPPLNPMADKAAVEHHLTEVFAACQPALTGKELALLVLDPDELRVVASAPLFCSAEHYENLQVQQPSRLVGLACLQYPDETARRATCKFLQKQEEKAHHGQPPQAPAAPAQAAAAAAPSGGSASLAAAPPPMTPTPALASNHMPLFSIGTHDLQRYNSQQKEIQRINSMTSEQLKEETQRKKLLKELHASRTFATHHIQANEYGTLGFHEYLAKRLDSTNFAFVAFSTFADHIASTMRFNGSPKQLDDAVDSAISKARSTVAWSQHEFANASARLLELFGKNVDYRRSQHQETSAPVMMQGCSVLASAFQLQNSLNEFLTSLTIGPRRHLSWQDRANIVTSTLASHGCGTHCLLALTFRDDAHLQLVLEKAIAEAEDRQRSHHAKAHSSSNSSSRHDTHEARKRHAPKQARDRQTNSGPKSKRSKRGADPRTEAIFTKFRDSPATKANCCLNFNALPGGCRMGSNCSRKHFCVACYNSTLDADQKVSKHGHSLFGGTCPAAAAKDLPDALPKGSSG